MKIKPQVFTYKNGLSIRLQLKLAHNCKNDFLHFRVYKLEQKIPKDLKSSKGTSKCFSGSNKTKMKNIYL